MQLRARWLCFFRVRRCGGSLMGTSTPTLPPEPKLPPPDPEDDPLDPGYGRPNPDEEPDVFPRLDPDSPRPQI
jgi:hypothetical protein